MINVRELSDKLAVQDAHLRQRFDDLITCVADGSDPAALARIVAEGLAAIHERQRTAIFITLQIS